MPHSTVKPSHWGKFFRIGILANALLLPLGNLAYAHKVNMFTYAEGSDIFVEGYFSDGKKAMNSTVTVYDFDDNELLQGTTNDEGQFTFPIPKASDLRIVLNAGMGHQTEYLLPASEIQGENLVENLVENTPLPTGNATDEITADGKSVHNGAFDKQIEHAVGQAIKPLMRTISEMREEKSLSAVIGGIGYIFGILGIVFYMQARKLASPSDKKLKDNDSRPKD